ncbi:MAG: hypothetical protein U0931_00355 [Vulcanimicrobiota bacterium]
MEKSRQSFLTWALISLALPTLYVLSTGPLVFYFDKMQCEPAPWVMTFYGPIDWAWGQPVLRKPLEAYLEAWRRLAR